GPTRASSAATVAEGRDMRRVRPPQTAALHVTELDSQPGYFGGSIGFGAAGHFPESLVRGAPSLGRVGVASARRRASGERRFTTTTVRSSSGVRRRVNSAIRSTNARVISLAGRSRRDRNPFLS